VRAFYSATLTFLCLCPGFAAVAEDSTVPAKMRCCMVIVPSVPPDRRGTDQSPLAVRVIQLPIKTRDDADRALWHENQGAAVVDVVTGSVRQFLTIIFDGYSVSRVANLSFAS
jgi:hypothetical protein